MKTCRILLSITIGMAFFFGCNDHDETVSPPAPLPGTPFEIQAWDYSTNHFFVDTTYLPYYELYYQSNPPIIHAETQVTDEEVWVESDRDPTHLVNSLRCVAYINLGPRGQGYDPGLRTAGQVPGQVESGRFYRLNRSEYSMTADGYIGVVSFKVPLRDDAAIGIAYRRANQIQFGEFLPEVVDTSSIVIILKMLKPRNLQSNGPAYPLAWRQLLKNIYPIGSHNVREVGFTLDILFAPSGSSPTNRILGQPLLRALRLDRYNPDGTPAPAGDGQFDFRPDVTIDPQEGEIILPFVRPFDEGLRRYFLNQGLVLPDTSIYLAPEVYAAI